VPSIQSRRRRGASAQGGVQVLKVSHVFSHRFSPDSGPANTTDISAGSCVLTPDYFSIFNFKSSIE